MTKKTIKIEDNYYYGMGLDIRKKNNQNMIEHSGVTLSFVSMLYIYPDLDLGIFVVTNTNDIICMEPTFDLFKNIEKFLVLDYYEGISTGLFFYVHFTYDIIFLIIISIPLTYLIITIKRKIKKKEYTWFKGIKGKIIFGIDIFILIIAPLITIIVLYIVDHFIIFALTYVRIAQFFLFTPCSILFLTFIIKLIYVFIFDKYFKSLRTNSSKGESLNNIDNENE